jgi:hypothetical protein
LLIPLLILPSIGESTTHQFHEIFCEQIFVEQWCNIFSHANDL